MKLLNNKFFAAPDHTLIEAAAGGAHLAAYIRLGIALIFWLGAIFISLHIENDGFERNVALIITTGFLLIASIVWYFSKKNTHVNIRYFVISFLDISMISFALLFFALSDKPDVAINSMVVWELYLIFIIGSSLYCDMRICLFNGIVAIIQYSMLLFWVKNTWDVNSNVYVEIDWFIQACRFLLLVCSTFIAIGIVVRIRKLLTVSGTDMLTGLVNRRVLEARLPQEISRAIREDDKLCIAYLDIDKFKKFNDTWGHATGDSVLKTFAKTLKQNFRHEDILSRWGGDEFVLVFPITDLNNANTLLNRIQGKLNDTPLPIADKEYRIKFSAGIAQFPEDGEHETTLIDIADTRLKYAKEHGRNQIITTIP